MPTETAAASAAWIKWGHVFSGAMGVAVTLAWMPSMTRRQMALAISSGMALAIYATPIAVAVARGWLMSELSIEVADGLAGLFGMLFGMTGIYITSGLLRMAEGFARNPWWVIDRLRGRQGGES